MSGYIIISTTTDSKEVSERIASCLLKLRLAACIQIHENVTSFFSWQNKVEKAKEFSLIIKTKKLLFSRVRDEIEKEHNYSVPQIVSIAIDNLSEDYKKWLNACL
jgi:periplasmic divalent cation tolerance protein